MAPPRPFAGALAASNPPPPILAPLAHGRSIEAPSGLVVGVARPVAALGGPAIPMPAQRSPLGTTRRSTDSSDAGDSSALAAPPDESAPRATAAASPAGPDASPGARQPALTTLTPLIRTTLTQAPEPSRRTPVVGLVGQPRASGTSHAPATPAAQAAPGVQRAPSTPPSPSPSPGAAPTASDPLPVASRLTIGQARRLGLGAPIAGAPIAGLPLGGAQLPSAATAATAALPTAPIASAEIGDRAPSGGAAGARLMPAEDPELPLVRARPSATTADEVDAPARSPGGSAASTAPAAPAGVASVRPTALARASAPAAGRLRMGSAPIVSARPLRAGIQRAPLTMPLPQPDRSGAASVAPRPGPGSSQPVRIHRGAEASDLAAALDARSFTHGGEIFMPASHGSLSSGKGQALLAHEMTHVVQQRRLANSLPGESSPQGRTLEAEAVAAERAPDLTLAPRATSQPREDHSQDAGTSISISAPASAGHAPQTQPQRAPNGGSGGAQGAGRGSKGHAHTEQELEVLAHQLYHRIGRHLRRELLVDRERAGLALDLP
jgi:hypothetical protein